MQTPQQLQQRLSDARAAYRALTTRGRSSHIPLSEYLQAGELVLEAERSLAAATGDQYAEPINLGFLPEASVSAPLILQNDNSTILTFNAVTTLPDGSRKTSGTGVIEFDLCRLTSFGYPNDEALAGHPLHGRGLAAYGIFDVHNSHWVRLKTEQNRVAFPNTKDSDSRHLIFSFHDSTFECICKGIKSSEISDRPFDETLAKISNRLLERHAGS